MTNNSWLAIAVLTLAVQGAQAEPPAGSDACNARIVEAAVKRVHVPNRQTGSLTAPGGHVRPVVIVTVDGKHFAQSPDGDWRTETWDPAKEEAELRRKGAAHTTCEAGGTDTIGGETADVLVQTYASSGDTGTIRTWISQATGLILRSDAHFTVRGAKTEVLSNYAYGDIAAPPAVH
jgi:hypothetical protein